MPVCGCACPYFIQVSVLGGIKCLPFNGYIDTSSVFLLLSSHRFHVWCILIDDVCGEKVHDQVPSDLPTVADFPGNQGGGFQAAKIKFHGLSYFSLEGGGGGDNRKDTQGLGL